MAKEIQIRIFPDGRIEAETHGVKGKQCRAYIPILEDLLQAEAISSEYTAEYHETVIQSVQQQGKHYEQQKQQ